MKCSDCPVTDKCKWYQKTPDGVCCFGDRSNCWGLGECELGEDCDWHENAENSVVICEEKKYPPESFGYHPDATLSLKKYREEVKMLLMCLSCPVKQTCQSMEKYRDAPEEQCCFGSWDENCENGKCTEKTECVVVTGAGDGVIAILKEFQELEFKTETLSGKDRHFLNWVAPPEVIGLVAYNPAALDRLSFISEDEIAGYAIWVEEEFDERESNSST